MNVAWDWQGDLHDDCTAVGYGLMLRAEQMSRRRWWWAVYDNEGRPGCEQIAASHDREPFHAKTGEQARAMAQSAANDHLAREEGSF